MKNALALFAALALAGTLPAISPARAAGNVTVKATNVGCPDLGASCHKMSTTKFKTLQHVTIHAGGAGQIIVNVSAWGGCQSANQTDPTTISAITQITDNPDPDGLLQLDAPGTKQMGFSFPVATADHNMATTTGLDSTRVFQVLQAGNFSYYFQHAVLHADPKTSCFIYGGNMTATFVPN